MSAIEAPKRSPTEQVRLADAERRATPFVRFRDVRGRMRIFELPESLVPVTIGRGALMDISLAWDDGVSRLHARLERVGDDWTVVDDGTSRNGTWLNGERVEGRRRLSHGDELTVGATSLRIAMPGRIDEGETARIDFDPGDSR